MRGATRDCVPSGNIDLQFQSTLLMRGATPCVSSHLRLCSHFNPRSSCEERLPVSAVTFGSALISIHAPHARSDLSATINSRRRLNFNPRSSCEERRKQAGKYGRFSHFNPRSSCEERRALSAQFRPAAKISIHAPHARSDNHRGAGQALARRISIHAPHARSDTRMGAQGRGNKISIHAPHARSDPFLPVRCRRAFRFQSTLLMRGATLCWRSICS